MSDDVGIVIASDIFYLTSHIIHRMSLRPSYFRVFLTFARNSLVRDMMFPANFIIETISSFGWVMMNVGFYLLIFEYTDQIGAGGDDGRPGTSISSSCSSPRACSSTASCRCSS